MQLLQPQRKKLESAIVAAGIFAEKDVNYEGQGQNRSDIYWVPIQDKEAVDTLPIYHLILRQLCKVGIIFLDVGMKKLGFGKLK